MFDHFGNDPDPVKGIGVILAEFALVSFHVLLKVLFRCLQCNDGNDDERIFKNNKCNLELPHVKEHMG